MKKIGVGQLFSESLVFVDIETDGLNHLNGHIVEVAAIRVENGKIVRKFTTLIDPGVELPYYITKLTGITSADLRGAPTFADVADELADILDGAIFVAHNVRFDYSFIKQEFKRLNRPFLPRQLCTVKLSRALFPEYRSHKLQSLIERYNFSYSSRHRAYDDAHILWQFLQYVQRTVAVEIVQAAVAQQLRQPAIPKYVDQKLVKNLPTAPGVYVFEDEQGRPLYVGKSINIKKRVLQHFGQDHADTKEFKLAQSVHHISTHVTEGELSALLLESQMIKELQPIFNRQLRRLHKLVTVRAEPNDAGYLQVSLSEARADDLLDDPTILATYPRPSQAKSGLETKLRQFDLCPKLLGLDRSKGACFWYQLSKCHGACIGEEPAETYNARLAIAFAGQEIESWPFTGPVLVKETAQSGLVVDDWCVVAKVQQDEGCDPQVVSRDKSFDLDAYKILRSFLTAKVASLTVQPLSGTQLLQLGLA